MLHRRRGDLATIARKAFFKNLELRLVGEAPPPPRIDDRQPAHRCPKTVLMPVHKDKTTDSHHALKAAAVGCLRRYKGYHFWARGYFVSTSGYDEQVVRRYIRNQEKVDKASDSADLFNRSY